MTLLIPLLSAALCMTDATARSVMPTTSQRMAFDIPAQPLGDALQAYAQATGLSVFFDGQLTASRHSMAVQGEFTPQDALQRLLEGSGLVARFTADTTLTLAEDLSASGSPPAVASEPPVPAALPPAEGNARAVQRALERALCRWPQVQPGGYRAVIQLWIGPAGHVQRTRMLASTGLPPRDAALRAAMETLVLAPPASEAEQPLTILLRPRSADSTDVCGEPAS
ncbi:STN domain-containing protein [Variovorax boronicumulans]|uniref:STN domain-containing protein n=1 Tax=Variovorax boronicumulans TaxID=436515 RepID=UPI001C56B9A8